MNPDSQAISWSIRDFVEICSSRRPASRFQWANILFLRAFLTAES
jgi:hypothetical protein